MRTCTVGIMLGAIGLASLQASAQDEKLYFPEADADWETVVPADVGFDQAKLDEAAKLAEAMHSSALLVLHQGRILLEHYSPIDEDSAHSSGGYQRMLQGYTDDGQPIEDVASVQKSVTAFLTGTAVTADKLSLDEPVSVYLPQGWSNATAAQESAITIRNLMSMTSGLTEALTYTEPPNSNWKYNTGAYSQMVKVLESIYSKPINDLSAELLTDRIGMSNSAWKSRGGAVRINNFGFTTTARDLARFGILIAANGKWDGDDLGVSQDYLKSMLTSSQKLNPNYGLLWWLNGKPADLQPGQQYRSIPNAPEDVVAALGALGRVLHVSRKEGLILVRLGNQPPREFSMEIWRLINEARKPH